MKKIKFATRGTCSTEIVIQLDKGKVKDVKFVGGCSGNLQAVARLAKGRDVEDLISLLEGIQCRDGTSCPDQLAKALKKHRGRWGEGETRMRAKI
jgi:uncharacterized protein (TIGR03905 family)